MATFTQEASHATKHFLTVYCVWKLTVVYMKVHDIVRAGWWRLWGFNPKENPEFHLSQMDFSPEMVQMIHRNTMIYQLITAVGDVDTSLTLYNYSVYTTRRYQRYDAYMAMHRVFADQVPGKKIYEYILKAEGVFDGRELYLLENSEEFRDLRDKFMNWHPQ